MFLNYRLMEMVQTRAEANETIPGPPYHHNAVKIIPAVHTVNHALNQDEQRPSVNNNVSLHNVSLLSIVGV